MRVRYTPFARLDIEEIGDYIQRRNSLGALRVRAAIRGAIELISAHPWHGRKQTTRNVRRVAVRKYPYNIYYRVDEAANEIVILNIRHAARKRTHRDA